MTSQNIDQTGLPYPIVIELEHGVVIRYRKLVYRFIPFGEQTADVSYESVLQRFLAAGEQPDDLPVGDVALGYRIGINDAMELYWVIELDGQRAIEPAQTGAVDR